MKMQLDFTAIVGTSFAGKSTLLSDLERDAILPSIAIIPEYCEYAGGNANFRHIPFPSLEEAKMNIDDFINWETLRQRDAVSNNSGSPIVMDRSIYCFLLTQLLLARFKPSWHNSFSYGVSAVAEEITNGRLVLPQRLIFMEPADEATFLERSERGVSVGLFRQLEAWRFFSYGYCFIVERLYRDGNGLKLLSDDSENCRPELTRRSREFIFSKHLSNEISVADFLETFAILGG